jgi:hypothetical protein
MKMIKFILLAIFLFIGYIYANKTYVINIITEPAGAILSLNDKHSGLCPKAPCSIEINENNVKITAVLDGYNTKDTNIIVGQPNQTVSIKLDVKTYLVHFTSIPSGVLLKLDGAFDARCFETPCKVHLKKGLIDISAALEQYIIKDTTFFIGKEDSSHVYIKLKSIFGFFNIRPSYLGNIGIDGWSFTFNGASSSFGKKNLLPGVYTIGLFNKWYEDIVDSVVIENDETINFDMIGKLKPKWGTLKVQPDYLDNMCNDEPWKWTINGESMIFGYAGLFPGRYEVLLTHRCYEDIEFNADIKKNDTTNFDMSKRLKLNKESRWVKQQWLKQRQLEQQQFGN